MRWIVAITGLGIGLAGCQPTCQSTCNRYYAVEECDAAPTGIAEGEALQLCVDVCEQAVLQPGPAPSPTDPRFVPTNSAPATSSPQIVNDLEAAAWMDCVWSFETREECSAALDRQSCVQVF